MARLGIGTDEEDTKARVEAFNTLYKDLVKEVTEDLFKEHGRSIQKNTTTLLTREQIASMSQKEIMENMELVQKSLEKH